MKIYLKTGNVMNTTKSMCNNQNKPLKQNNSIIEPKKQLSSNNNIVGLGLANNDKLMALNIKKKKHKNIAFEL